MARPSKRTNRAALRQQAAALNVAGMGLLLALLPHVISQKVIAAALKPLAPFGWLMLAAGAVTMVVLHRRHNVPAATTSETRVSASPRPPRRPERPLPQVERIDPICEPAFVLEDGSSATPGQTAQSARLRPTAWGANVWAAIEWRRFEAVVEALFAQAGFMTKAQSHGPDEGIDVWLYSKHQPDGAPVSVVQCKHWQGKPVGVDKIRELRGVMAAKGVTRGQFATTSTFTADATAFAAVNGIKLHDGAGLLDIIAKRTPEQQQALLTTALAGEYWRPTCASCGIKLVEREPMAGGKPFWGCVNFPKCRTTMAKRTT